MWRSMSNVTLINSLHTDCLQLFVTGVKKLISLFPLFKKVTTQSSTPPAPLSNHKFKLGGVENFNGVSCTFSVLLQEFAASPEYYDSLFLDPLHKDNQETDQHFAQRQALQKRLYESIQKIRSGETIPKSTIKEIADLFKAIGWQGDLTLSLWKRFLLVLHQIAPTVFKTPLPDAHSLYDMILKSIFEGFCDPTHSLNAFKQNTTISLSKQLAQKIATETSKFSLWKVADPISQGPLSEKIQVNNHQFTLKVALELQDKTHVVAYRKLENMWICCNDDKLTEVAAPPSKNLYAVVYECCPC